MPGRDRTTHCIARWKTRNIRYIIVNQQLNPQQINSGPATSVTSLLINNLTATDRQHFCLLARHPSLLGSTGDPPDGMTGATQSNEDSSILMRQRPIWVQFAAFAKSLKLLKQLCHRSRFRIKTSDDRRTC
jgi:hypothetical protein